jgi:hypothetical protein
MTTHTVRAALAAFVLSLSVAAHGEPPATYPSFKGQQTSKLYVAAKVGAGTSLPQFKSTCPEGSVCISLNPPPFWFEVDVLQPVYGKETPKKFYGATVSHYGAVGFGTGKPVLARFETNGSDFIMSRYGFTPLASKKNGELYLILRSDRPLHWLPCTIASLQEEIAAVDFVDELVYSSMLLDSYEVETFPKMYRLTDKIAIPRYAISINRLHAHLRELAPSDDQLDCK